MPSMSIRSKRECTSWTISSLTMPLMYIIDTSVLVTRPICCVSSQRLGSFIFRRINAVLVRKLSVKASFGPLMTVSVVLSVTPRSFQPRIPMVNPLLYPSSKRITSPDNSEVNKELNSVTSLISPTVSM
ncbi:hypothetical protein D3C76_1502090 [compost metagenome]